MRALLDATQLLQRAVIQGEHELVAEKAQAIHDSFILEQEMSDQQRQTLRDTVPMDFLEADKQFHELSASLAQAGKDQDTAEQLRLFKRMIGSCVGCHSRYARDRFPDLGDRQSQP